MKEKHSFLKLIESNIDQFGYHLTFVKGAIEPKFVYSIGLSSGLGFELVFAGGLYYLEDDVYDIFANVVQKLKKLEGALEKQNFDLGELGTFRLAPVNSSWNKIMLLGIADYYRDVEINSLQILPDTIHKTLDVPDMSVEWDESREPIWKWLVKPWNHAVPSNSTAITNIEALRGEGVTEVMRWDVDEWEMFAGNGSEVENATGRKLRKANATTSTVTDYVDGIQYENNAIDFISNEEGRAVNNSGTFVYEYNLTDHLGNVRYVFNRHPVTGAIQELQKSDYYPFGKRFGTGGTNRYLYNGKELQEELAQYDYGARFYDSEIGRWNVVDPLAELHFNITPYNYVMNSPVVFMDMFGLDTVRSSQIVPPKPGVRPFDSDKDVVQLDYIHIKHVKRQTLPLDNLANHPVSIMKDDGKRHDSDDSMIKNLQAINKPREIINEFNPSRYKNAGKVANALDALSVFNSNSKQEAIEKVTSLATEKVITRYLGTTGLQP